MANRTGIGSKIELSVAFKKSKCPDCIGRISCEKEEFFGELEKAAKEIHRILKPDKVMAWLTTFFI